MISVAACRPQFMLLRSVYYALTPHLPWRLRMGMRRMLARHLRRITTDRWPIDPAASKQPEGWPGWPGGKKFAVVLTHDVEGSDGLARCRELAEQEIQLGFRSSFNFVPEGNYKQDPDLRAWLTQNGFEVGVHDLEHDGHLFSSQAEFDRKAERINHYLRDWDAKGFRAGFMLRQLDWLHQLDISYDCSTFDTDPFDPQPESAGTIFPFWVPAPGAEGDEQGRRLCGVALYLAAGFHPFCRPPGTLQCHLARQAGMGRCPWRMVLLNVHPDYLQFCGRGPEPQRTVLEHYLDLLRFLQTRFTDAYWHALPHEVAAFVRNWRLSRPRHHELSS